jgi:hypothetical protein
MRTKLIAGSMAAIAASILGVAAACSTGTEPASIPAPTYGPSVSFAQGTARAFIQTDAAGVPTSLGIAMTEAALSGLPTTVSGPNPTALMVSLPLPATAVATGFDHAELGWNPNGHEPQALYALPHFDLHFYMVSSATQMAILPSDPQFGAKASNLPAASFVPLGYVPPPAPVAASAIPQMGVHWTDTKSPELTGRGFSSTFIYGSWDGKFIFLEPMVTKAYLETHPASTQVVPQPTQWASSGYYPTSYVVAYDAAAKEYRFTLGALAKH